MKQVRIGLEIHVRPITQTKLFCGCAADFGGTPNTRCCPRCLGFPGALPSLNRRAVEQAVKAGLLLDCEIPPYSEFVRKAYHYPDLPKGYQITQLERPICQNGEIRLPERTVRIWRIQLEEDAGKLIHDQGDCTKIDYNRCGLPLLEIVTAPDLQTPEEAEALVREIRNRLKRYGVSLCRMERGELRMDVNISVEGGERVEIKNMNSLRFMKKALWYEIQRQTEVLQQGGIIDYETRRYDEHQGVTQHMRSKEHAPDYRFFPEPDLPPLRLTQRDVAAIRATLVPVDPQGQS